MVFHLIIFAVVLLFSILLGWNLLRRDRADGIFFILMSLVFVGGFGGALVGVIVRDVTTEEVPVKWPIYETNGRYLHDGTSGEYNKPVTIYYYKDNGVLRKSWKASGSTGVKTTYGDDAYVHATCPDTSTAWDWTLYPWEDPAPNCDNEFFTFYIPEGAS